MNEELKKRAQEIYENTPYSFEKISNDSLNLLGKKVAPTQLKTWGVEWKKKLKDEDKFRSVADKVFEAIMRADDKELSQLVNSWTSLMYKLVPTDQRSEKPTQQELLDLIRDVQRER